VCMLILDKGQLSGRACEMQKAVKMVLIHHRSNRLAVGRFLNGQV
jgi:hypothetical protein